VSSPSPAAPRSNPLKNRAQPEFGKLWEEMSEPVEDSADGVRRIERQLFAATNRRGARASYHILLSTKRTALVSHIPYFFERRAKVA
jgi:hypothetical protein